MERERERAIEIDPAILSLLSNLLTLNFSSRKFAYEEDYLTLFENVVGNVVFACVKQLPHSHELFSSCHKKCIVCC